MSIFLDFESLGTFLCSLKQFTLNIHGSTVLLKTLQVLNFPFNLRIVK